MKKFCSFLLIFSSFSAIAQTTSEDYYGSPAHPKLLSKDRVSASITAGTGVSFTNGSKATSFTTYIAPKINYQLSKKFSLDLGFMHYMSSPNSLMYMNRNEAIYNPSNSNVSGNLVFVGGEYQLNKKTIVSGAVMTDVNSINKQNSYKAASIGLDYKVSEHASIGFKATISNGQGNYYNNPNPMNNSLFPASSANPFSGFGNQWMR
jgi:hypothetical protein